jgi:Flp pilus assembly protein TadG
LETKRLLSLRGERRPGFATRARNGRHYLPVCGVSPWAAAHSVSLAEGIRSMYVPRAARRRRRAVATVEFALLLPIVLLFLTGIWEVGRLVEVNQVLDNAAREGARQASTAQAHYADVQTAVTNALNDAGITNLNGLTVQVQNLTTNDTGPGTDGSGVADYDPTSASSGDRLQVTVTLPFNNVRWLTLGVITNSSTTLNGQTVFRSLADQSYPGSITVPNGF